MILKKTVVLLILFFRIAECQEIFWKSRIKLGSIGKVVIENNKIYLSDLSQTKIYVFDMKGNLVRTIGRKGQGPGEIMRIDDFDLWENKLFIKESGVKIKKFDIEGKEIESINLDKFGIYFNKFFVINKDKLLLIGIDTSKPPKEIENNKYNIFHIIDIMNGKKNSFGFPLPGLKNKKYPFHIILLMEINFTKYGDIIYFCDIFKYRIYRVNLKRLLQEELIKERVDYFLPVRGDLEVYHKNNSTVVATNLLIPEVRVFYDNGLIFVIVKKDKALWIREYYWKDTKYILRKEKELINVENIYYLKNGIFYGVNKDYDLIAFKLSGE